MKKLSVSMFPIFVFLHLLINHFLKMYKIVICPNLLKLIKNIDFKYLAQLSRMAYIRDDELHQIFLSHRDGENNLQKPPEDPKPPKA